MLLDISRLLGWLVLCILVAVIEYSTGLPVVTVTLLLLAILRLSTVWFLLFITVASMILAALFSESWLVVWVLLMVSALLFRLPSSANQQTFITRVSLVVLVSLLLSVIRDPVVTPTFLIHSCVSLIISAYILWRRMRPKTKSFDITELRFASEK